MKSRLGGSPAGRYARRVLISCVGAWPPSSGGKHELVELFMHVRRELSDELCPQGVIRVRHGVCGPQDVPKLGQAVCSRSRDEHRAR